MTTSYQHSLPGEQQGVGSDGQQQDLLHPRLHGNHQKYLLPLTIFLMAAFLAFHGGVNVGLEGGVRGSNSNSMAIAPTSNILEAHVAKKRSHHYDDEDNHDDGQDDDDQDENVHEHTHEHEHVETGEDNRDMPDWNDEKGRYDWQKCKDSKDPNCWKEEGERVHGFWSDFNNRMKNWWHGLFGGGGDAAAKEKDDSGKDDSSTETETVVDEPESTGPESPAEESPAEDQASDAVADTDTDTGVDEAGDSGDAKAGK